MKQSHLLKSLILGAVLTIVMPLTTHALTISSTNFPDANFREALKPYCNNQDNFISDTRLQNITELDVSDKNISNLKGIEYFTYLKKLNCSKNNLEYLNVSALTNLEVLTCNNNKLISLSVASNTELTELDCQNNQLRALYIGPNLSKLVSVFCYDNQMNYSAVRRLASTLPSFSNGGFHGIVLYNPTSSSEKNCIVANSRFNTGWMVLCYESQTTVQPVLYEVSDEPAPLLISTAYFQDTKLLNIMKTYDKNNDGYWSADELHQVSSLDVSGKGLTTLKGIEYLTNLQYLYVDNNDLTSLNVSKNYFLHYMTCYQNRIFDTEMDNLITSLPPLLAKECYSVSVGSDVVPATGLAYGRFVCHKATNSSPWEGNIITASQLQKSDSKNWFGFVYKNNSWSIYSTDNPIEGQLHINQKTFPDSWFRTMVQHGHWENVPSTAFDDNYDGYLSQTERNAVEEIWLDDEWLYEGQYPYDKVTSLQGIEYFPNLSELSCVNTTGLTAKTDLSRNTKLTYLFLYCNGQVALPRSLQILTLSNKSITSLNLQYQTALTSLDLNASNLSTLNITRCTQLKSLSVNCKSLKSLDVSNNQQLQTLYVGGCEQLRELVTSSNNSQLTSLNCSNTKLTTINVANLPALNDFRCYGTNIRELDLSRNTNLKKLDCRNCQLLDLDLENNTKLVELNCSHNNLQWLTLPSSCSSLTNLSIQGNYLNDAQINAIVGKLPIVSSSGTERYICLSYSDASEMNMIGFSRVKTLINTKKWKVRFEKDASNVYYYQATNAIYGNNNNSNDKRLNFWLNNSEKVSGITFDLVLPEDITLAQANGKFVVTGTTKVPASGINVTFTGTDPKTKANIYHVSLSKSGGITATTGENVMALEIFPLRSGTFYSNCINTYMRTTLGQDIYVGPYSGTITITKPYTLGDVNKDGQITPADAIMILYNYFDVEQNGFDEKLADVNKDGQITPADAIEALYMYFQEDTPAASRKADKTSATEAAIPDPE